MVARRGGENFRVDERTVAKEEGGDFYSAEKKGKTFYFPKSRT